MPQNFSLFDTYLRQKVVLDPGSTVQKDTIKLYSCGPTVYNYQSIGNMRAAWLPDTISKVAKLAGWKVEWTLNITDVGHLVSDGDEGEDKIEKGAKRDGKTVEQIVNYYTNDYKNQCKALHLDIPEGKFNPKATDYIKEQMLLALELLVNDLAYLTEDGIYFDTLAVATAEQLNLSSTARNFLQKSESIKKTSKFTDRDILETNKKHPDDFAVWKFVSEKNLQKWKFNEVEETEELMISLMQKLDSSDYDLPNRWGTPGWHSECVCMICGTLNGHFPPKITGNQAVIDIHTGGEDHIDIHHKNEMLQSEALGFNLSTYWVHNKFVMVDGGKMSKSLGNVFLVTGTFEDTGFYSLTNPPEEISAKLQAKYGISGFNPLAYRLMLMEHHYTEQMNFTWEKLTQSQTRLNNVKKDVAAIRFFAEHKMDCVTGEKTVSEKQKQVLLDYLLDNLNTPKFVEKFQEMMAETLSEMNKNGTLNARNVAAIELWEREFLQLDLLPIIPEEVLNLAQKRAVAKQEKNWAVADTLRDEAKQAGYQIDDYAWGWSVWKVG